MTASATTSLPRQRKTAPMPELAVLKERLDTLIAQRAEDQRRDAEWRDKFDGKQDEILSQARKTNGRVDGHDTEIARVHDFMNNSREWRQCLENRLCRIDSALDELRRSEDRRRGAIVAVGAIASAIGGIISWAATAIWKH